MEADSDIWLAVRRDGERGAKRLVAEYGDRLFAAATLLCADDGDAEELVFRTLDQAVRKIARYEPRADFFNWLYTIMLNFRRMSLRRRRVKVVAMGASADLPEPSEPLFAATVADAAFDDLREAVRHLPDPLREVVTMRYFLEMPVEAMARVLAVPVGTIKSRLHRARTTLYGLLTGNGKETGL